MSPVDPARASGWVLLTVSARVNPVLAVASGAVHADAPRAAGLGLRGGSSSSLWLSSSAQRALRALREVSIACPAGVMKMCGGYFLVILAPAATAASTATSLATRGATPAQQPPVSTCLGWRHGRAERRPAGAGLGPAVKASASAKPVGRRGPWEAASSIATVGNGEERSREWRALRGSPEEGSRPHSLMLMPLMLITIGMRREESAASAGAGEPSSLLTRGGRGR